MKKFEMDLGVSRDVGVTSVNKIHQIGEKSKVSHVTINALNRKRSPF